MSSDDFVHCWRAPGAARAALALAPGLRCEDGCQGFVEAVARQGFTVYATTRGRATSSAEVERLVSEVRRREPGLPLFLLGHGAGGVSACRYALEHPGSIDGLICAAITLDLPFSELSRWLLPAAAVVSARARSVTQLLRTSAMLRPALARLTVPLLVIHGSADTVARPAGSEQLHELAGSPDKTLQIFEGYHHGLVSNQGYDPVVRRVCTWMAERLAGPLPRTQVGIAYINEP